MYFKKTALLSLALFSLPLITHADLTTWNYTDEDSSVKITSGTKHYCSIEFGIYTPKRNADGTPGYSYSKDGDINFLCITSQNKTCEADIYNTSNCTGQVVGKAKLDLTTHAVTWIESQDSKYTFKMLNGNTLELRYSA